MPQLAALSREDQAFVLQFVETSGSLKEMAKLLGVSYPTVRNRLNEIIATLASQSGGSNKPKSNKKEKDE